MAILVIFLRKMAIFSNFDLATLPVSALLQFTIVLWSQLKNAPSKNSRLIINIFKTKFLFLGLALGLLKLIKSVQECLQTSNYFNIYCLFQFGHPLGWYFVANQKKNSSSFLKLEQNQKMKWKLLLFGFRQKEKEKKSNLSICFCLFQLRRRDNENFRLK
jgi:hypothetical protein